MDRLPFSDAAKLTSLKGMLPEPKGASDGRTWRRRLPEQRAARDRPRRKGARPLGGAEFLAKPGQRRCFDVIANGETLAAAINDVATLRLQINAGRMKSTLHGGVRPRLVSMAHGLRRPGSCSSRSTSAPAALRKK